MRGPGLPGARLQVSTGFPLVEVEGECDDEVFLGKFLVDSFGRAIEVCIRAKLFLGFPSVPQLKHGGVMFYDRLQHVIPINFRRHECSGTRFPAYCR